jgi:hypothetical protein
LLSPIVHLSADRTLFRGGKPACGRKRFLPIQRFVNVLGQSSVPAGAATDDVEQCISLGVHTYLIGNSRI